MSFIIICEVKDEWKYLWFSKGMSFSKALANCTEYTKHVLLHLVFRIASVNGSKRKSTSCSELPTGFKMKTLNHIASIYNDKKNFH